MGITVLRIGHRISRDVRMTTHCALVARALGADGMIYTGEHDRNMEESVKKVAKEWGGSFSIAHEKGWNSLLTKWEGKKVHLTIYGLPVQKWIGRIRKEKHLLVIVGGEKVPGGIYQLADYNLAVTNQPHSEIGALAIFLHEYFRGRELEKRFPVARRIVVPQKRGKKILKK